MRHLGQAAKLLGLCLVLAAVAAGAAHAQTSVGATKDVYTVQVNAICASAQSDNAARNRRIDRLFSHSSRRRQSQPSFWRKFARIALPLENRYLQMVEEVAAVPQPPADVAQLTAWIDKMRTAESLWIAADKAYGAGKITQGNALAYEAQVTWDASKALISGYSVPDCL